jgi:tRNA G18 (ribose-2'-O)-methylase SpoU
MKKISLLLDNIRSAHNVGGIFRTADAVGCEHIYLCGITANIDNPKLYKTALGATKSVSSSYHPDVTNALEQIDKEGLPLISLELTEDAEHFQKTEYPEEFVLVVGHEIRGVDQLLLDRSEKVVYIPMRGIKDSLNVAISASVALYEAMRE